MERNCLMINDEALIDKLEYFLYEYSGIEYNDINIVLNFSFGNKLDNKRTRNADNIYELRKMLSYNSTDAQLDEQTLGEAIDLFLLFLRTYSLETTMALNGLLDTIRKSGKEGHKWNCVRRITGILATVYLLYFVNKAKMFDANETESNMKDIFRKNIDFYSIEDKRFLTQIFMAAKRNDCLIELLHSYLQVCDEDEKFTDESERIMANEFFRILYRLKNAEKYNDAILFLDEGKYLFRNVSTLDLQGRLEKERAVLLFNLGKYEEAKLIFDKYIDSFDESNNLHDFSNKAIFYALTIHFKEKSDADWKECIDKAFGLISYAEKHVLKSDDLYKGGGTGILYHILFEKSYLLFEKGKYDKAYDYLKYAFSKTCEETKRASHFIFHMLTLMRYMFSHPEEHEIVESWIECFYNHFRYKNLKKYDVILDFVNSSKYLRNKPKLFLDIYKRLFQLLFHALEIRHETKIRDVSQYDIRYYAKTEHLKLLLQDETSENCSYRLPMFHVYHMNDPQEGKILRGLLEKVKFASVDTEESSDSGNQYEENYVFLKSFFCSPKSSSDNSIKEFLPMWVQYGDDAQGCCVVLNNKTFENSSLHRVVYLTDDGKCDENEERDKNVGKFLDDFLSTYRELVSFCDKEIDLSTKDGKGCLLGIKSLVKYITSQISYLFKNQLYKHENEVRLIADRTSDKLDDVKVIPGSVPKIYIYNDSQTYIDEVILGAKIVNPEDYVPFIYKQGRKMWGEDAPSQIKVTHSTIQYR